MGTRRRSLPGSVPPARGHRWEGGDAYAEAQERGSRECRVACGGDRRVDRPDSSVSSWSGRWWAWPTISGGHRRTWSARQLAAGPASWLYRLLLPVIPITFSVLYATEKVSDGAFGSRVPVWCGSAVMSTGTGVRARVAVAGAWTGAVPGGTGGRTGRGCEARGFRAASALLTKPGSRCRRRDYLISLALSV